jgi:hypothetical protein
MASSGSGVSKQDPSSPLYDCFICVRLLKILCRKTRDGILTKKSGLFVSAAPYKKNVRKMFGTSSNWGTSHQLFANLK